MRTFDKAELGRTAMQYGFVRDTSNSRVEEAKHEINTNSHVSRHALPRLETGTLSCLSPAVKGGAA